MQEKITVDHQDVKKLQDVFIEDLERKIITLGKNNMDSISGFWRSLKNS